MTTKKTPAKPKPKAPNTRRPRRKTMAEALRALPPEDLSYDDISRLAFAFLGDLDSKVAPETPAAIRAKVDSLKVLMTVVEKKGQQEKGVSKTDELVALLKSINEDD